MSKLRFPIAMSLDGFVAGPGQDADNPLGVGGMRLHEWVFPLALWREMEGQEGGEVNESTPVMKAKMANLGATVMGRNMFGGGPGPWDDDDPAVPQRGPGGRDGDPSGADLARRRGTALREPGRRQSTACPCRNGGSPRCHPPHVRASLSSAPSPSEAMTGRVHLCWSPHSTDASRMHWLDGTELGRFDRLKKREDRQRFLTSRILLKTMVGHLSDCDPALVRLSYDCPGCGRPHGRPIVVEPRAAVRWHASLSQASRYVMAAVTDAGPVGVDIERVAATRFDGFDDVALTAVERSEVERCATAEQAWARAVYWARKEAVLKAVGLGLRVDPRTLQVSAPHLPAALTAWHLDKPPPAVQLTDVPVEDDTAGGKVVSDGVDEDNVENERLVAAVAVLADSPFEVALQPPWGSGRGQVR